MFRHPFSIVSLLYFRCKCRHFQPQEDLICDCEHFGEGSLGALFCCLRRAGGDRAGDGTLDCVSITPPSALQTLGLQCLQIEIYISGFHRRFSLCQAKHSSRTSVRCNLYRLFCFSEWIQDPIGGSVLPVSKPDDGRRLDREQGWGDTRSGVQ